jgi:hypothetical protein
VGNIGIRGKEKVQNVVEKGRKIKGKLKEKR